MHRLPSTANGTLTAKPIVYAVTIPNNAPHREWALKYVQFLLGAAGQETMVANGFGSIGPAIANDVDKLPLELKSSVRPWPSR
jgi:molybdate/tungstate transport system substrate-binding protein